VAEALEELVGEALAQLQEVNTRERTALLLLHSSENPEVSIRLYERLNFVMQRLRLALDELERSLALGVSALQATQTVIEPRAMIAEVQYAIQDTRALPELGQGGASASARRITEMMLVSGAIIEPQRFKLGRLDS